MKRRVWMVILVSSLWAQLHAECAESGAPKARWVDGAVTVTNLTQVLGLHAWNFKFTLSGLTNGLAVLVQVKDEGKPPTQVFEARVDRDLLNNEIFGKNAGREVPVFLAIHPVGNMQGETITSARELRFLVQFPYSVSQEIKKNPFYHAKEGVTIHTSTYVDSNHAAVLFHSGSKKGQRRELMVSFREF